MTLEEHARAIEAAIQAAADDGFELDNGYGDLPRLELNDYDVIRWERLYVAEPSKQE
ncbi:hypothetical protein OTB20_08460 [Streptomyces sp. H27-H1]|uniref:hypothetical protein n=1 Tax=Streptomyces sp. H27-H1 TaxID=2996461 RepID=UPI00226D7964|nr:hypothetical protein [Streptomyces sp. H27-H1]MCY0926237.1 hypothetical protein [Streptomyces sp. H27-H1]